MNKHPEDVKTSVVNRYLNGEQISKISHDMDISRTTAYTWIKQHNSSFNKGKAPNFRYLHDLEQKCERQQKMIEILKRSPYCPSAPLSKKYEVIKALSTEYNVNTSCTKTAYFQSEPAQKHFTSNNWNERITFYNSNSMFPVPMKFG